jgi:hypothetical protein
MQCARVSEEQTHVACLRMRTLKERTIRMKCKEASFAGSLDAGEKRR